MTNTVGLHVTGRGGNCSRATCHVYVQPTGLLDEPAVEEIEMPDTLLHQTPISRLACQVTLAAGIGSVKIRVVPEE
ncbi:hypothetical protein [Rhizobium sp.]